MMEKTCVGFLAKQSSVFSRACVSSAPKNNTWRVNYLAATDGHGLTE